MRSVLITSFQSLVSRNILATRVLATLLEDPAVRIVIACPAKKRAFFEREFGSERVAILPITARLTWRDGLLRYLALAAVRTTTLSLKRQTELAGRGRYLSLVLANGAGQRLVRALSRLLTPHAPFGALLDELRPALVFATDVGNELDVRLMEAARVRSVRVVGMVRSWDNLTAKGLLRVIPETLVVNNEVLAEEGRRIQGVPAERIVVVGIPHYDAYVHEARTERRAFFQTTGGDPAKRTCLFVPTGDRYLAANTVDADLIDILERALPRDWQILVRLPPGDLVRAVEGGPLSPRVLLDRPSGAFASVKDTELSSADDRHLADTLYHADLVVAGPSTMVIDAAFFDRPVILAGFDGYQERPYLASVRRYFDYDHFKPVIASGGAPLAASERELCELVARYRADRAEGREGRMRLVQAECYKKDGRASERLSALLRMKLAA